MKNRNVFLLSERLLGSKVGRKIDKEMLEAQFTDWMTGALVGRETKVLVMHYGIGRNPMSVPEIAKEFDLTAERMRSIIGKAIRKLAKSYLGPHATKVRTLVEKVDMEDDPKKLQAKVADLTEKCNFYQQQFKAMERLLMEALQTCRVRGACVDIRESIDNLNLNTRATDNLKADNIFTIEQLLERSEYDIVRVPRFGKKSLAELKDVLAGMGLRLKQSS